MRELVTYLNKLIDEDLSQTNDNLYRAEMEFKGKDMNEFHGSFGKTRKEIVSLYMKRRNMAIMSKELLDGL